MKDLSMLNVSATKIPNFFRMCLFYEIMKTHKISGPKYKYFKSYLKKLLGGYKIIPPQAE